MKCICITGAIQTDLELVSNILQKGGMKSPKPAKRSDQVDIASWHEQALTMDTNEVETGYSINPGRFMEQLASDIFVANIKVDIWGWADARSTRLLDFWLNFDPRLYFVLVYISPQQMLASAISSQTEIESISAAMDTWQTHYQQLLRFHLRNPQRSFLINALECAENPQRLIARCAEQWKLQIATPVFLDPIQTAQDSLALYLAQHLCQDYPQTTSLQHEIAATLTHLAETGQNVNTIPLSAKHIISDYRALRDRSSELEQLQTVCEELANLRSDFSDAVNDHAQQQKEFETKLKNASQENESLLLQIHNFKKELEAYFIKHESVQKLSNDQQVKITTLTKARDDQSAFAVERQAKIDQLTKRHDETVVRHTEQQKNAEQENKLLLLQLHQVQEELEHYFLQHQDQQKRLQNAETRWQRMLQRNPDYCDYDSIEVLPAESNEKNTVIWRIKDLNAVGHCLPELEFKTILEQGIAGFVFSRQSGNDCPLVRWPINLANQNELLFSFIGIDSNRQQLIETFLDFSCSDWRFFHVLARQLESILEQPSAFIAPAGFNPGPLLAGLGKLREIIEKFPATFRYDQVTLKNQQVNPGYEHLWLRFEKLGLGAKHWPEFEFRISCANIQPNHFGAFPHLEFPEGSGRMPFEDWFAESHDDFGAKLELRFALPDSMDMGVWQRVSEGDASVISALIMRLPNILASLQKDGLQLNRSWEDWIAMSKELQRIFISRVALHVAPSEAQRSTRSKETKIKKTTLAKSPAPKVAQISKSLKSK